MDRPDTLPPPSRIAAAFVIAPLVAATAMACYEPLYAGLQSGIERVVRTLFVYCAFGAYPSTVTVGIPAYFYLRSRVRPTALNCAFAGGFVATVPWLILALVIPPPDSAFFGGHVVVVHGHRTLWWWLQSAQTILNVGVFGLLGGLAFWLVAVAGLKFKAAAPP